MSNAKANPIPLPGEAFMDGEIIVAGHAGLHGSQIDLSVRGDVVQQSIEGAITSTIRPECHLDGDPDKAFTVRRWLVTDPDAIWVSAGGFKFCVSQKDVKKIVMALLIAAREYETTPG